MRSIANIASVAHDDFARAIRNLGAAPIIEAGRLTIEQSTSQRGRENLIFRLNSHGMGFLFQVRHVKITHRSACESLIAHCTISLWATGKSQFCQAPLIRVNGQENRTPNTGRERNVVHQISPYLIRCSNPSSTKQEDRYHKLDAIGAHDLFDVLHAYTETVVDNYAMVEKTKHAFRFSEVSSCATKRVIFGWMELGTYGVKSDIVNTSTGKVDFKKTVNNADILKHYFCFLLPKGMDEGIALMHSFRGSGIKTIFYDGFHQYFQELIDRRLQMSPLAYEAAFKDWQEADTKELRVTKFVGPTDIADLVSKLGHVEQQYVLKPSKGSSFGKLKDLFKKGSEHHKVVELLSPLGARVKTVVDLGGRRRTFVVGNNASNSICDIEVDDTVKLDGGMPVLTSIHKWSLQLLKEFSEKMYPGIQVLS